jgi:hypothetical protein
MFHQYSYAATLAAAERIDWRVEDVIGPGTQLDFSRPFLPETFVRAEALPFLSPRERLVLNQIRGHGYLSILGLVEEFILPFVLDHARPLLEGTDDHRIRALLGFAAEEAKHIHLFKRFRTAFAAGFGAECGVIGPGRDLARTVLAHDPLSVALVVLHLEWMTQLHYLDSVLDDDQLEPCFVSLLKHHWMEEAQHAKLDTLIVEALAATRSTAEFDKAVDGYLTIGAVLDAALKQQVAHDLDSLERAIGRSLSASERERFITVQHQANRWTYLGSGMTHRHFLATVEQFSPSAKLRLQALAPALC